MGIFDFLKGKKKNQGSIMPNEMKVLDLLLAGEHPTLKGLKDQLMSDSILYVERSSGLVKNISGISVLDIKSCYQLQFVRSCEKSMSLGKELSFKIDDLVITNQLDGREIHFELIVYEGEIAILSGVTPTGVFPFDFKVGDWNYKRRDDNGKIILSKERDLTKIPLAKSKRVSKSLTGFQKWILEQKCEEIFNDNGEKLDLVLEPAASMEVLRKFELENEVDLPGDYKEFLRVTNGSNFFGENIYSIQECYRIDDPQFNQFIPFHSWVDGNLTAFHIEENFSVYYLSHDPLGYAKIADSFTNWLKGVKDEIKSEGRLVYPCEKRKGTMYNCDLILKR